MITVLLADDQALIRSAVAELISHEPGFTVVGQVADGREALAATREHRPDVVVMDIRMPVMDGIQATAAIRAEPDLDSTRILILTTFEEDEYVLEALKAGASGFVGKGTQPDALMQAIRTVHEGESLLSPKATTALIARYLVPAPAALPVSTALAVLTDRERQVLAEVARGRSNSEIAADLFISVQTAKTHVSRIMSKLAARDRTHLVIAAYESGLVSPSG
ncbi:MAG TPA: response regulator transcription factor [Pseudolysinimonas sp.]|nr:response regulator transcription factor [Pseudolysinimonas sp.]